MRLYFGSYFSLPSLARKMPSSISGTNLAGSFTNFFTVSPPTIEFLVLARRAIGDAELRAKVVHHRRDGDDAWIGRVFAAVARELLAAAFRDPRLGALDRVVRDGRCELQHLARVRVRLGGVLVHQVTNRDQRVEQRLVAELRAAALLNALDGGRQHPVEVVERDRRAIFRQRARAHESRAPDRARAAADVLRDQHADLEQQPADRAVVERLPFLLDGAETRGQRNAEVGVAGVRVELAEVLLVLERGRGDRFDRSFDVRQGDFLHLFLLPSRGRIDHAARCAPMALRSFSVTRTFGGLPSSGTTLPAPWKSSSFV